MTLQEQIDRILELDAKRQQGEWVAEEGDCNIDLGEHGAIYDEGGHTEEDAQFIASAPTMVEIIRKQSEMLKVAKEAILRALTEARQIILDDLGTEIESIEEALKILQ